MSRELSVSELALVRAGHDLRSSIYLIAHRPTTVWTSTVLTAPASDDRSTQFTSNDNATADFVVGMTIQVTDTVTGRVKGHCRLRAFTNGNPAVGIGETSDIEWVVGDTVTLLDEFLIWPRAIRIVSTATIYIDEVTYGAQHTNLNPIPVMGPDIVPRLAGGTVTTEWDSSDSWVPGGVPVVFNWTVTPNVGVTIVGGNTATPTITFTHAVTHRVTCSVSYAGQTSYGHRYAFVLPNAGFTSEDSSYMATDALQLSSCEGDWDSGGWSFGVTLYDDATLADVRERALCILCADDYYDSTQNNINLYEGALAVGRNNIVALGWISSESIEWNPDVGRVSFTVSGPQYWLDKETNFSIGVFDTDFPTLPVTSGWALMSNLTVDKAIWHILYWRSTATLVIDTHPTGDTRQISVADAPVGSVWQQHTATAEETILAHPACNRFGALYVSLNPQAVPFASRAIVDVYNQSVVPVGLHTTDWRDTLTIEHRVIDEAAQVDSSGTSYLNGVANAYFSLAPGHMPSHYGAMDRRERLALSSQAQANELCGLIRGMLNNPYPSTSIPLAYHNRVVDIAPPQCLGMTLQATDTERGIEWPDDEDVRYGLDRKRLLVRRVSHEFGEDTGVMLVNVDCEAETFPSLSTTGDPPPNPPDPPPPPDPPYPVIPPVVTNTSVIVYNQTNVAVTTNFFDPGITDWGSIKPLGITFIYSVSVDPDGYGAWLLSGDGVENPVTSVVDGVFRTDDVTASPVIWTLVLSQYDASVLGHVELKSLVFPGAPPNGAYNGEMVSFISWGNGKCLAVNGGWAGFLNRHPACTFSTDDLGATWTAAVISGNSVNWFWVNRFFYTGFNRVDLYNGTLYIVGTQKNVGIALAESVDGLSWAITGGPSGIDARSTNVAASNSYCFDEATENTYIFPNTIFSLATPDSFMYRRTAFANDLVYITTNPLNTKNYLWTGNSGFTDSDLVGYRFGIARVFGLNQGIVARAQSTILDPVVCLIDNGVYTDKTGDLVVACGGTWAGMWLSGKDNSGIIVFGQVIP